MYYVPINVPTNVPLYVPTPYIRTYIPTCLMCTCIRTYIDDTFSSTCIIRKLTVITVKSKTCNTDLPHAKFVLDLQSTRYKTVNYRFECPEALFTAGLIEGCTKTVQELCYESVMTQDDPQLITDLFQVY